MGQATVDELAKALQQTFRDVGDVGMMLAMGASCDFSPIPKDKK